MIFPVLPIRVALLTAALSLFAGYAAAQSPPSGFTLCPGTVSSDPDYPERFCAVPADPDAGAEGYAFTSDTCEEPPAWRPYGYSGPGGELGMTISLFCYGSGGFVLGANPDGRGALAFRRLYTEPPDGDPECPPNTICAAEALELSWMVGACFLAVAAVRFIARSAQS